MAVLGVFEDGRVLVRETVAGPASYAAAARPTVVFDDLSQGVETLLAVTGDDGRIVERIGAVVGRTVTFRVLFFDYDAIADGVAIEIVDATDLSGDNYTFLAVGR